MRSRLLGEGRPSLGEGAQLVDWRLRELDHLCHPTHSAERVVSIDDVLAAVAVFWSTWLTAPYV